MVISVCNGQDDENKMSEGDAKEPNDPTQLTLILALFIYPECFLMKGYEISELGTVDDVRTEASILAKVPKETLIVTFKEQILRNEDSLKSYGMRTGDTLMITRTFIGKEPEKPKKLTESEFQTLVKAFKGFKRDTKSKAVFEKLADVNFFQRVVDTAPGLEDDVCGYSLVRNPRLFIQMGDPDVLRRAIEHHPWVAVAAWNFIAIVEKERVNMPDVPETSTNHSALSDDEDRETPQVPDELPSNTPGIGPRLRDEPVVTATQLAAALAAALGGPSTSRTPLQPSPVMPPVSTRTPMFHPPSTGHDFVTPEMFNEAVRRAYANMPSRSQDGASTSRRQPEGPPELSREQLAHQMSQLQELGLVDEAVNLRALRITGGDVQGAVDLIFGGLWLGDEGPEVEVESMQESE